MVEENVCPHLHKLSAIKSEVVIDHILSTLWNSRTTGLSSSDMSHFQSLLNLPSPSHLHPVLVCLRSLIRKCAYHNFNGDDLLKLFPSDLPLHLQTILVLSFHKHKDQWKQDVFSEKHLLPPTDVSHQVTTNVSPSTFQWLHQEDPLTRLNHSEFGISMPLAAEMNGSVQSDIASSDNLDNLPRLKSMSWTMENHGTSTGDKVAIICLKLYDQSKSVFGETEVKFKLSRDTLEAMLRSLTYISEQLSSAGGTGSMSANKKQKR